MKIKELMEMATVAGGIATVSKPMGETQKRNQGVKVAGLEPAEKVISGKAKKKGPYVNSLSEGKMADLAESLTEDDLSEQDLIIVPGQKMKRKTGFIQHGQSRVDHEVEMARSDVLATMKNAKAIYEFLKNRSEDEGLEGWVQEKLIKANDYLNSVKEYYDEKMMQEMTGGVIAAGGVGESAKLSEKFASQQQAKLMYATAGGADTGVSKKVAREVIKKSHGQKVGSLPKKVEKK